MTGLRLKAIVPEAQYDIGDLQKRWRKVAKKNADRARREMKKTAQSWDKQPRFRVTTARGNPLVIRATTDNPIWALLNKGAPPHEIRARNAPRLRFQRDFTSKTQPRVIKSRRGGKFGNRWRSPVKVRHPGHEPREWTVVIGEKLNPKFHDDINKELREWARRTLKMPRPRRA